MYHKPFLSGSSDEQLRVFSFLLQYLCKHQATIDYAALTQATSETVLLADRCTTFRRYVPVQRCEPLAQ